MKLEICAYNRESCLVAMHAGAARIEFCAGPEVGGTTPDFNDIVAVFKAVSIPVFPIIRPRGGNFVFNEQEIDQIRKDIIQCREVGCPGISTGAANHDGTINRELMARIMDWAGPMEVTCHKVFDETPDPFDAMELLLQLGVSRILTSGQENTAMEGAPLLAKLVREAAGRICIMPGGGVRAGNLAPLIAATGAAEYHSSGITKIENGRYTCDGAEITQMLRVLRATSDFPGK